jgi:hypothetical protein
MLLSATFGEPQKIKTQLNWIVPVLVALTLYFKRSTLLVLMERDHLHRAVMHEGHALRAILLSHALAIKFIKIKEKKNNWILKMLNVSQTISFIYTCRWLVLSKVSINHFVLWHAFLFFINIKIMKWIKGFDLQVGPYVVIISLYLLMACYFRKEKKPFLMVRSMFNSNCFNVVKFYWNAFKPFTTNFYQTIIFLFLNIYFFPPDWIN